jgi:hypothetical protein
LETPSSKVETPRRQDAKEIRIDPQITQIYADDDLFAAQLSAADLPSPAEARFAKAGGGNNRI